MTDSASGGPQVEARFLAALPVACAESRHGHAHPLAADVHIDLLAGHASDDPLSAERRPAGPAAQFRAAQGAERPQGAFRCRRSSATAPSCGPCFCPQSSRGRRSKEPAPTGRAAAWRPRASAFSLRLPTMRSISAFASRTLLVHPVVDPPLQHGLALRKPRLALAERLACGLDGAAALASSLCRSRSIPATSSSSRARCAGELRLAPGLARPRVGDELRIEQPNREAISKRQASSRRAVEQAVRRRVRVRD